MNLFNLSNNNLDEVIFEQRNKAYGAYAIRKAYPDHLNRSVLYTLTPLLLFLLTGMVWNHFHKIEMPSFNPAPFNGNSRPFKEKINLVSGFSFILDIPTDAFRIVPDKHVQHIVRKKEIIKPIEHSISGSGNKGLPNLPNLGGFGPFGIPGGGGDGKDNPNKEPLIIETTAQKMPEFPGGVEAMYDYIRQNLHYPRLALDNGIQGKVVISFVIMPDGTVQMSNLERGIGFGCDDEAMRVINEMPEWEPAQQNGRKVPVRMILPVVFQTSF